MPSLRRDVKTLVTEVRDTGRRNPECWHLEKGGTVYMSRFLGSDYL